MNFNLTQAQAEKTINHFGRQFYEKLLIHLKTYTERWTLSIYEMVDYYSVNCIFICYSEQYGDCVLKIGNPSREFFTEFSTLTEYNGRRFCRVYDADIENGVMLEERIVPGKRLRDVKDIFERLSIFSHLFNDLHIQSTNPSKYPTYYEWVCRIAEYMKTRGDHKELYLYMEKAKEICTALCSIYNKSVLLHGDLHHDNILLGKDGVYKIIDPKGVTGDPIFDIPRFIINEFYAVDHISFSDYKTHVDTMAEFFEKSLCVSREVVIKCIFIETTMANCWNVESSEEPEMEYVRHAEAMLE